MTTSYVELEARLHQFLGINNLNDHADTAVEQSARDLFHQRTLFVSSETGGFSETHESVALQRVVNELLSTKSLQPISPPETREESRLLWKFLGEVCLNAATRSVVDRTVTRCAIEYHYSTIRPHQFDIFVHLSGSDMFFIDGDSLLMAALSSPHVDWDLTQTLHIHHNAQALLHRLQRRGANFHVVFFEQQRWFWEKAPQKLLMRESLRLALTEVARSNPKCGFRVESFKSFTDPLFHKHVESYDPEFFLMSDGEQLGELSWLQALYHNTEADVDQDEFKSTYRSIVDDEKIGNDVAFYYHCFLLWAQARRIKVAFSSRIVTRENAAIVFTATVRNAQFSRALLLDGPAKNFAVELERSLTLPAVPSKAVDICSKEADLYFREKVSAGAVYAYLHRPDHSASEQEKQMCLALLVTAYTMVYFDLPERAQRRSFCPEMSDFLSSISPYMLQVFSESQEFWTGVEFDILDGHLLCSVAANLRERSVASVLTEQLLEDVEIAWVDILGESADLLRKPLSELPEVTLDEEVAPGRCLHLEHDLVNDLSKRFQVRMNDAAARPIPGGNGNAEKLHGWTIEESFVWLNDVVDRKKLEEMKENIPEWKRNVEEQVEASFKKDAQRQAESMGLTNFLTERLKLVTGAVETDTVRQKKEHAGQKNKQTSTLNDTIFNKLISDAAELVVEWDGRVRKATLELSKGKALEAVRVDDAIRDLKVTLGKLRSARFEASFHPDESKSNSNLKQTVWRSLVEQFAVQNSGNEALFLSEMVALQGAGKKSQPRFVTFLNEVPAGLTGKKEGEKGYLFWVMLSYIRVHFCAKLMCCVLRLYLSKWRAERDTARLNSRTPNIDVGTSMFIWTHHQVLACVRDTGIKLSTEDMNTVRSALAFFDFPQEYYAKVDAAISQWQGQRLEPLPVSQQPREKVWNASPERTQLLFMGHKLERPVIVEKDYRVGFNPDLWQRELLDIVDRRASAVVCAPTSAGKTFISYYCMLKALKTSNTRMVAYVAPTRALINQAVVDVCARYGSKPYNRPGMNVYGILGGGDYHRYHDNCQVIITLPEVLETLLLSPAYRHIIDLLDYVILDEIHTMESNGNGDVWERVLSLLPCPFVALSATLGQTEKLCSWLNRVQDRLRIQEGDDKRDYRVYNVPSTGEPIQRWNDIKKYIYLPPPHYAPKMKKITSEYENRYIKDLHPLSILTLDQIRGGFPPDISLVPSEVVELYEVMLKVFESIRESWPRVIKVLHMEAQLKALSPEEYFKSYTYITQRLARQYEHDVKIAFVQWVNLTYEQNIGAVVDEARVPLSLEEVKSFQLFMAEKCTSVLKSFSLQLQEEENLLNNEAMKALQEEESSQNATQNAVSMFPDSKQFIASNIISVLRELRSRSMGPTIVFSFESQDCEELVRAVVEQLEAAESEYRKTDEYRAQEERRKALVQKALEKQKQSESSKKQKRSKDKEGDAMRNERGMDDDFDDEFIDENEPEVLEEFTFLRKLMYATGDKPNYEASSVRSALASSADHDLARRAILRGIGIHHAGIKGKVRREMEVLFRTGYSGVIFATETLALGIHSPCRSVVLAGDHVLLNPTQFRQMMGRAGRRGVDDLGHLVFFSVSIKKITRLMTSGTTVIKGNVQMNAVSLLRMLQLYEYPSHNLFMKGKDGSEKRGGDWNEKKIANWKKGVLNLTERLFVNPLFYAGTDAVEDHNLESLTVRIFQMLLGYFHREGLYNTEKPSALGSLLVDGMHVFRNAGVGAEGFAFMNMLTNDVFAEADFPTDFEYLDSKVHTGGRRAEAVTELLAYLFSSQKMCNIPLEIHRSALSDPAVEKLWMKSKNSKHHRVVLAPLRLLNPHGVVIDYARAFSVISAFYTWLSTEMKTPSSKRLYYMNHRSCRADPLFGSGAGSSSFPLRESLQQTAVRFSARNPFVAISGCGDRFVNMEDLSTTLRDGLFCDAQMLPLYDFTDGCRHDGAQVVMNACLADFIRCQADHDPLRGNAFRFTQLETLNGLSQSEAYAVLNHALVVLGNIAGTSASYDVIQTLYPSEDEEQPYLAGADLVVEVAQSLHNLRQQIG